MSDTSFRSRFVRAQPPGGIVYLAAAALVLVCLEALIYLVLLRDTIGPFVFFGSVPRPTIDLTRPLRALLVSDGATGFEPGPIRARRLARWERAAAAAGLPVEHISVGQLAKGTAAGSVLVLPAVVSLDDAGRQALLGALAAGTGLVASGALGSRDAEGASRGYDLLLRLTGAAAAESVAQGACSVTFAGGRFFSDTVPPGRRLELPAQDLVVLRARNPDAFLSDHLLRPLHGESPEQAALAVHATRDAGRVVWFGFDETVLPERHFDQQALEDYLADALRWAARKAIAVRASWPGGRQAAALVAVQLDRAGPDADALLDTFRRDLVPATFFVTSRLARESPALVKRLRAASEVASAVDAGEPLVHLTPRRQVERLRAARGEIEAAAGPGVVGLSPPQGLVNAGTIVAMNEAGHRYVIGDASTSRAVPDIVEFQQSLLFPLQKAEVTKLYRAGADDLELLAETQDDPVPRLLADFRRILELGGLYTLHVHDDLLGSPAQRAALARVLTALRSSPAWVASGGEIVRWWSGRQKVEVSVRPLGPRRLHLEVANKGLRDVEDVSVLLFLPYRPERVGVRSPVFRLELPEYRLDERAELLRLRFVKLKQQSSYLYFVTFDE